MKYFDTQNFAIVNNQLIFDLEKQNEKIGNGFMNLNSDAFINRVGGFPDNDLLKGNRRSERPKQIINYNRTFDTDDLGNLKIGNGMIKKSITLKTSPIPVAKPISNYQIGKTKKYNNLRFEL